MMHDGVISVQVQCICRCFLRSCGAGVHYAVAFGKRNCFCLAAEIFNHEFVRIDAAYLAGGIYRDYDFGGFNSAYRTASIAYLAHQCKYAQRIFTPVVVKRDAVIPEKRQELILFAPQPLCIPDAVLVSVRVICNALYAVLEFLYYMCGNVFCLFFVFFPTRLWPILARHTACQTAS